MRPLTDSRISLAKVKTNERQKVEDNAKDEDEVSHHYSEEGKQIDSGRKSKTKDASQNVKDDDFNIAPGGGGDRHEVTTAVKDALKSRGLMQ